MNAISPLDDSATLVIKHNSALPDRHPNEVSSGESIILAAGEALSTTFDPQNPDQGAMYSHCVATASIIAELGLSSELVAFALLHHATGDQAGRIAESLLARLRSAAEMGNQDWFTWEQLAHYEMSARNGGSTGIGALDFGHAAVRDILLANWELIPVLLAGSLDTMKRLKSTGGLVGADLHLSQDGSRFAEDVYDYLAPFTHYYHLDSLTWQLEDAYYSVAQPEDYCRLQQEVQDPGNQPRQVVDELAHLVSNCLEAEFDRAQELFQVSGRPKSIFSIARKLSQGDGVGDVWDLGDLFALRVVIADPLSLRGRHGFGTLADAAMPETEKVFRACAQVMEACANEFGLCPGHINDHIHHPAPTGYQSLHFCVPLPSQLRADFPLCARMSHFEIQVRTADMHRRAEYGEWAHFKYKLEERAAEEEVGSDPIREAKRLWNIRWADHFMKNIAFRNRSGRVLHIPRGATYADAAYMLCARGRHPRAVRVYGGGTTPVNLTFEDNHFFEPLVPWSRICVIGTGTPAAAPSPARLASVRTTGCRTNLAGLLRRLGRDRQLVAEDLEAQGRRLLEETQELNRRWSYKLDPNLPTTAEALQGMEDRNTRRIRSVEQLYAGLGAGRLEPIDVTLALHKRFQHFAELECKRRWSYREEHWLERLSAGGLRLEPSSSILSLCQFGMNQWTLQDAVIPAPCCGPVPGDRVSAWNVDVPRGGAVSGLVSVVHRFDCPVARHQGTHIVRAGEWTTGETGRRYRGHIEFLVVDRPGLLAQIASTIGGLKPPANINRIAAYPVYDQATDVWLEVDVHDLAELRSVSERVYAQLKPYIILYSAEDRPLSPLW